MTFWQAGKFTVQITDKQTGAIFTFVFCSYEQFLRLTLLGKYFPFKNRFDSHFKIDSTRSSAECRSYERDHPYQGVNTYHTSFIVVSLDERGHQIGSALNLAQMGKDYVPNTALIASKFQVNWDKLPKKNIEYNFVLF